MNQLLQAVFIAGKEGGVLFDQFNDCGVASYDDDNFGCLGFTHSFFSFPKGCNMASKRTHTGHFWVCRFLLAFHQKKHLPRPCQFNHIIFDGFLCFPIFPVAPSISHQNNHHGKNADQSFYGTAVLIGSAVVSIKLKHGLKRFLTFPSESQEIDTNQVDHFEKK